MNAILVSAEMMGRDAHAAGIKAAPCLDAKLMKLIGLLALPIGGSVPVLKAWSRGWHLANAA